ncbi:MAG: cytochrome b N-terminal domain-containing protein [Thermoleophilia bacterium]|nr:cytochrome b N-terminal domain-containing protein [Thermoleophilia bacterium]
MRPFKAIGDFFDERFEMRRVLREFADHNVPDHVNWLYCFGGITFLCFLIQAFTGILLAFYYQPTMDDAYSSVLFIMEEVPYGAIVRSLHAWTANIMIIMVIIHMLRVFFHGAYRPPREMNWLTGVLLFFMTITFGFSGYLLPMNQLAYWATKVGTEIAGAMPFVGSYVQVFLMGGERISDATLTRFYTIHVIILPVVLSLFLVLHFVMIRKQGISEPL